MKGLKELGRKGYHGMQEIQQTVIQVQEATPFWQQCLIAAIGAVVSVIAGYYVKKWWNNKKPAKK